eukprot:CAMPEP_0170503846 /NCGR_PEP_ID=MMETSP0208-20121228/46076_1 /TAXON_ID=197538 /ORGANISM="Strombidium inclinatum, Strain S3" /LENGTH=122 /DNA_ID=CAMNT_0010783723 /DNA_START=1 /DNA_END=366 /DNA_ORIENTATION=+
MGSPILKVPDHGMRNFRPTAWKYVQALRLKGIPDGQVVTLLDGNSIYTGPLKDGRFQKIEITTYSKSIEVSNIIPSLIEFSGNPKVWDQLKDWALEHPLKRGLERHTFLKKSGEKESIRITW